MSVERIERKGGAVWRVRWRDAQGRERSKVIGRKRDAEVFEAEVIRRKRTGDLDLLTGGRETLAEFAEEWWKLYAVPNLASAHAPELREVVGSTCWAEAWLDATQRDHARSRRALSGGTGSGWSGAADRASGARRSFKESCGAPSSGGGSATTPSRQ